MKQLLFSSVYSCMINIPLIPAIGVMNLIPVTVRLIMMSSLSYATRPLSRCYLRYITMLKSNLVQESNAKYKNNLGMIKTTPRALPSKTRVENECNKRTKSITRCHTVSDHIASNIVKVGG